MPLVSKLFSTPLDAKLEAALADDRHHITPGASGEHVRKIQIALNRLNEGRGQTTFLAMDGIFGKATALAVKAYKKKRNIMLPWQTEPDDFVGKRTMKSLDDEMDFLENETPVASRYICVDMDGAPHDHSKCPAYTAGNESKPDGTISHLMTPLNPVGSGRMLNIGGQGEANYLGFVDCVPDPACDKPFMADWVNGRMLTSMVSSGTVSDICFRSTPLDTWMQTEIRRICMRGARLTLTSNRISNYDPQTDTMDQTVEFLKRIGTIIEYGVIVPKDGPRDYVVATITSVDPRLPKCTARRTSAAAMAARATLRRR